MDAPEPDRDAAFPLRRHFRRREWAAAQAHDIERINAAADRLNEEAEDVLEYQAPLWNED